MDDFIELRPDLLFYNPLFVWGGAILSGFFGSTELRPPPRQSKPSCSKSGKR